MVEGAAAGVGEQAGCAVRGHHVPGEVAAGAHVVILDHGNSDAGSLVARAARPIGLHGGAGGRHRRRPCLLEAQAGNRAVRRRRRDALGRQVGEHERRRRALVGDDATHCRDPLPVGGLRSCVDPATRGVELGAQRPQGGEVIHHRSVADPCHLGMARHDRPHRRSRVGPEPDRDRERRGWCRVGDRVPKGVVRLRCDRDRAGGGACRHRDLGPVAEGAVRAAVDDAQGPAG